MTSGTEVMRLRLGVLPLFASQRLFPRLGALRAKHPELHLDIDTMGHGIQRVGDGLDAAIVCASYLGITVEDGARWRDLLAHQAFERACLDRGMPTRPSDTDILTELAAGIRGELASALGVRASIMTLPVLSPAEFALLREVRVSDEDRESASLMLVIADQAPLGDGLRARGAGAPRSARVGESPPRPAAGATDPRPPGPSGSRGARAA